MRPWLVVVGLACACAAAAPDAPASPSADACRIAIDAVLEATTGPVSLRAPARSCRAALAAAATRRDVERRDRAFPSGPGWRCPGRCGPSDRSWIEVTPAGDGCFAVRKRHATGGSASRMCIDEHGAALNDVVLW